jgi:hypothetical protein
MTFFQVWIAGYYNPFKLVVAVRDGPAPRWGFYATLLRGALDSLLIYLPLTLAGGQPALQSMITLIPTEQYYLYSVFFMPAFFLAQWLLLSALVNLIIRLAGQQSSFDSVLNITGISGLVVGTILVPWDWLWILAGWSNETALGISHIIFAMYSVFITTLGLHQICRLKIRFALLLNLVWMGTGIFLAMVIVRPPV